MIEENNELEKALGNEEKSLDNKEGDFKFAFENGEESKEESKKKETNYHDGGNKYGKKYLESLLG